MQDIIIFLQNHWLLTSVFFITVILVFIIEFIKTKHDTIRLAPNAVIQMINKNATVLDIRSEASYKNGHIINSISIPTEALEMKLKKIEKLKNKPIIIACNNGNNTLPILNKLNKLGFTHLYSLKGGIDAWNREGFPLVK